MLVSFFVILFVFNSFTLITCQSASDLPQHEGYIHRYLEMSYFQLIISHQIRSYSNVKAISTLRFTCFRVFRVIWTKWAKIPKFFDLVTQKNIQSLQLHISHQMRPYASVEAIHGFSFTCFWNLGTLDQKRPQITQLLDLVAQKVIQSLQLLNSNQRRPYSSVEAIVGLDFTCFSVLGAFEQSKETTPK